MSTTSSLRQALSRHEPARGKKYPEALEKRAVEYARAQRMAGVSWNRIASELGLRYETVRQWVEKAGAAKKTPTMRAVKVVAERARPTVSIVSPSGARIEGVTLDDAVAVLRALG